MRFAYPLLLDVADRQIVIIGGGAVAKRKVEGLLDAGATKIRVVALQFHPDVPQSIERVTAGYEAKHLDGAQLVFATTDRPEVNDRIVRDARSRGIWVNRSDEGEPGGDFATPAKHAEGDVILAVSAGSAALSAAVRDNLAARLDRRLVQMAGAMQSLRPLIRDSKLDSDRRKAIFRDLADEEALSVMETGGVDQLRRWLAARYPELKL